MTEISEVVALAEGLKPDAFLERISYWRSGAGSSWLSDYVNQSRSPAIPVADDGGIKDRLDRELQLARRDYTNCLDDAVRLLRTATALEAKWLFDIAQATEDLADLVSDYPSCLGCGETREQWERTHKNQRIRVKRGCYPDCYEAFRRSGEEFSVWAGRKKLEATA